MHVQNSSAQAFAGWIPTTVAGAGPDAPAIAGSLRFVPGDPIGLPGRGRRLDVLVSLAAGVDLHQALTPSTPDPFDTTARDAAVADPATALGGTLTLCGEPLPIIGATGEGAAAVFHARGRFTSMLLADVFVRFYPGQHFALTEVVITASNPAVTQMGGVVPADCVLRLTGATSSFHTSSVVTDHTVLLAPGEVLADGQARAFTGLLYWPARIAALGAGAAAVNNSIAALRSGRVGAVDEAWASAIGPLQQAAAAGAGFSASAWVAQHFGAARDRLGGWSAGDLGIVARSRDAGDQGDQGFGGKGTPAFLPGGGPMAVTALYWDALGVARRPCHHREQDGSLLSLTTHPDLFLWDSRPHFEGNNSPDRLGKLRALAEGEARGWWGPDKQHWFYFGLCAAYQLTGSPALQLLIETQARNLYYSLGPTGVHAHIDADRGIGWPLMTAAAVYVTLADRAVAETLRTRVVAYVDQALLPYTAQRPVWQPRNDPGLLGEVWRNQSGANPYAQVFFAYQAAVGAGGLYMFGVVFDHAQARAHALTSALGVLDRAYSQHPPSPGDSRGRWVEWDFVGHPATGAPLPASAFVEGAGAHRATSPAGAPLHMPGWYATKWFPFAAWVVLREQPAHARANSIWSQISAEAAASSQILEWFPPVTPEQAAAAPTGLQAVATETQVALTWVDNASTEDHYEVERADPATMAWAVIASPAANATTYTDTGVAIGQALAYRVAAVTAGGLRSYSAVVQVVIPGLPTTPASLAAVAHASEARIDLAWPDASAGRDSFLVQWSPTGTSGWADLATVPAGRSTHSDTSVPRGTRRWYRVAARYQNLQSGWSPVASAQTAGLLTPPTGLTAAAHATLPQVALSWANPTNGALSVEIQHSPNGAAPWAVLATVGATAFAHTDTTIGYGQTRHYRAVVRNAVGPSGPSNVASATAAAGLPAAPTGLTVTPHATLQRLTLAWSAPSSPTPILAYEVERSPDGQVGWASLPAVGAEVLSTTDEQVTYGQTWHYRVRARNGQGPGAWVEPQAATVFHGLPAAPTAPSATAHGSLPQITVGWSLGGSVTPLRAHEVQRSADGATNWERLADDLGAGATSYVDEALLSGQTRHYRVRGRNAQGWGAFSAVVSATTAGVEPTDPVEPEPGTPAAPSGLQATTGASPGEIDLAWTDNATDETSQEIQRSTVSADGPWGPLASIAADLEAHTDATVLPSQQAWYRVRAVNGAGPSLWSDVATATASEYEPVYAPPALPDVPNAPSDLVATAHPTDAVVTLAWEDNAADESGFEVQRGYVPALPSTEIAWAAAGTVGANVTSFVDASVRPGQALAYRVRAVNANGPSGWCSAQYVTTAGVEAPPADPATLVAFAVAARPRLAQLELIWDAAAVPPGGVVELQRSPNGVDGWADLPAAPPDTPGGLFVDGATGWASTWFYRGRVNVAGRRSLWSAVISATSSPEPGPSRPPSNLRARVVDGRTELTWEDNSDDEIYFLPQRSSDGGRTWRNAVEPGEIPAGATSWTIEG